MLTEGRGQYLEKHSLTDLDMVRRKRRILNILLMSLVIE